MEEEKIYCQATIQKSISNDEWETDEDGNPVVIIEASNNNLDFQEEKVLQEALMNSKEYFLRNGVISYDHKHTPSKENYENDPQWNEEKYILGHPIDAWMENGIVKVKAVLYPHVDRANEIIKKLRSKAKTVKASVGGRRPVKVNKYDFDLMKEIPTIVKVLWDEVALTYKPVNQTLGHTILSPKEFVKALEAGRSANPAEMMNGNALQRQSLQGNVIRGLVAMMSVGDISNKKEAIDYLKENGVSLKEAKEIFRAINNNKSFIGDVIMARKNENSDVLEKSIDDTTEVLLKALDAIGSADDSDDEEDNSKLEKAMKKAKIKAEEIEEEDEDEDDEEEDEDDEDEIDITEDMEKMKKSLSSITKENKELKKMVKSLTDSTKAISRVLGAIGEHSIATSEMMKSIGSAPMGERKSVIDVNERFKKSVGDKISASGVSKEGLRQIGYQLQREGAVGTDFVSRMNMRFQKGLPLDADMTQAIESKLK